MDRIIVYPGSIPQDTDILNTNRNTMIGLGYLAQMLAGTSTLVSGLACEPTSPASLTVTVGDGSILSLETVDSTAYGSLAADSYPLVKMGINAGAATSFPLTPPTTSGDSINYLIEATFSETDVDPLVLPYYNASNPSQPYSGPNGSGTSQNTLRQQAVELQLKAGVAAPAGTQTTPAVDSGYVGLWVVTVNYGQTAITSADIAAYPSAPFLPYTLPTVQNVGKNLAVFTASGNWTAPAGVTKVKAIVTGGGGGGGGSTTTQAGGSGGAGGTAIGVYSVTPGTQYVVTVGNGGAGGTAGGGTGGAGGTSSFDAFASATGGGGAGASNGIGGGAGGGQINVTGGDGEDAGATNQSCTGGASYWGGGNSAVGSTGYGPAGCYGAGGGGAYGSAALTADAGANGIVVLEW